MTHSVYHILIEQWKSILEREAATRTAAEEIVYRKEIITFWYDVNNSLMQTMRQRIIAEIDLLEQPANN